MASSEIGALMSRLVGFRTVTTNQGECLKLLQFVESLFSDLPVEVHYFEHNGVHSQIIVPKGMDWQTPAVLLNGHIDVVPPAHELQFMVVKKGDKAFGRGTADMKGAAAAAILAFHDVIAANSQASCGLFFTADEEIGGKNGARYVVEECGLRPGFVLVVDGCREDAPQIVTKSKGALWLEVRTVGKNAHAAYPWLGENALDKLLDAIASIKSFVGPSVEDAWQSTMNVARIETENSTPNIIPKDARAVIDIRFTEALAADPEELLAKLRRMLSECELKMMSSVALSYVPEDQPLVAKYQRIASEVHRAPVPFGFSHGATDGRYFAAKGAVTIVVGPEGGALHGAEEWVSLASLEELKQTVKKFLG